MRLLHSFAVLIALFGSATPAQAQPMPQCGQVITTNFTLMGDWGCGNEPALIVGANGLKINLNGHTLSGTPAIRMIDVDGTTVRNGTIPSNIEAVEATNTRFVDMTMGQPSSASGGDWTGSTVTFVRSKITMWRLFCGTRCQFQDSTSSLNQIYSDHLVLRGGGWHAINFVGALKADVVNTTLHALTIGGLERLTIRGSELKGAEVIATGRIELLNNTFSTGNWLGVHRPVSGIIRGNRFEKMQQAGLAVRAPSTLNGPLLVERNTFADNRRDGLRIDVPIPLDITVRRNTSENNGQYGMWAPEGAVIDGGRNVSNNDALGCFTIVCGSGG
ncbi:right-handed parallel beta-helix repeat-containing protein [Lentzea flaviverrucosa]|uniref:Right handed beta helix region n=1 Tax=Lentzea flaviverrucosa TaxID=200379 RepID=A0A1H9PTX0_9PSEU|nr:right-handed parallel beta-helix repeat-containing protein [Lentzea flaviverrucosa]RDI29733.1 parallel beta helix pectate lyase-like protein [Lentzea flaviverrucosa]SER51726.1 Right handed beta helix region [Lentzea flaviverrucosa]